MVSKVLSFYQSNLYLIPYSVSIAPSVFLDPEALKILYNAFRDASLEEETRDDILERIQGTLAKYEDGPLKLCGELAPVLSRTLR